MEVSKLIIPSNGLQVTVNIKDAAARDAIANLDGISPSDVKDKDATLSWGTKTTIATIGELSIHVTLPSNPDTNVVTSVSGKTGNVTLGKSDVGLGNVTNDAQVKRTEMGAASGVATLGTDGKVPSSQLPSYVDDVLEYAKLSSFPATGESGKIYITQDTNKTYRWSGSAYAEISPSIVIGTTTGTAFDGKSGYDHVNNTSNPHGVTKSQVGLGSVVNTGDSATPVSGGTTKFTTGGAYTELAKKVDKVDGKGLSTNDYTTSEKNKLSGIESGAQVHKAPTAAEVKSALGTGSGTSKYLREDGTWVTPPNDNTTYSSKAAASGGTDVSLVTTGEKYAWNSKTSNTGTVTKVTAGTGLTGGDITTTGTIALATSGVTAGTYKRVTVDAYGRVTSGDNADADTNTAQLQVSDTTNKRINTKESTGNYIQFTGGTNKFTVGDGTNSFDVAVTPSVSFPVSSVAGNTGAVTTAQIASALTSAGYKLTDTDTNTWRPVSDSVSSTASDTAASSKAVKTAYDLAASKTSNTGTVTSVAAGTGLSGGTITTSGTLSVKYGTAAGTACEGNDSRLSNSRPASDVYSWAKASSKPTYIASEVMSISSQSISANTSSSCSITGSGNAGKAQTIIYVNSGSSDVTVTVPTTYSTPSAEAIELTCPAGGYCEVSYLNIGGTIYARGL